MSSTYSNSLRIELIGSGDQAGAWGSTTDNNFGYILDTAIAGYQTVAVAAADQALTYISGPTSSAALNQSVYAMLRLTTSTAANFAVYAPPVSKSYIIYNNSGYTATIYNSTVIGNTTAAGAGIAITDGNKVLVFSDGTNFYTINAANLTGTLAIANGGTGQTTANAALNALLPAQTASTTTNKYLKSDGTNTSWDLINLGSTSTVNAGSFVVGTTYTILTVGTTSFTSIGAASNTVGVVFTATGVGSGSGTATLADYAGVLAVVAGGTGTTTSTGSGSTVLSTSPTLVTPTLTTPTENNGTYNFPTINNFTLGTYGNIKALFETATITAAAPASTTNFDIATQAVQYYTSNTSTNFTLNIRGSATSTVTAGSFVVGTIYTIATIGTTDFTLIGAASNTVGVIFTATGAGTGSGTATTGTLNSILSIGQSVTCTLLVTNGTTAYYPNVIQIDGSTVTPKWQTGIAPSANYPSSVTVYTFSIIKTANATFTVLGSQVKFA